MKRKRKLTINAVATTSSKCNLFVIRGVPQTAKLGTYSVLPAIGNHLEQANDNLISQFKDCPNINLLLKFAMDELDKAQVDIEDLQESIFNLEAAEGTNLDLCGMYVGITRVGSQSDRVFRNRILAQVFINICDGTLPKILNALLIRYNLAFSPDSKQEIQLKTRYHNTLEIYVRDPALYYEHGGLETVNQLVSAGTQVQVIAASREAADLEYMALGSYYIADDSEIDGKSVGSFYDDSIGGDLVGICNVIDLDDSTVVGITDYPEPILTNKTIPVPTQYG
jgi:hypothetical protein